MTTQNGIDFIKSDLLIYISFNDIFDYPYSRG